MVIVMKAGAPRQEIEKIKERLETDGRKISVIEGTSYSVLGITGDTTGVDADEIEANIYVEKVMKVQQSYKLANRLFHSDDSRIAVGDRIIGGSELAVIAGPCSVESEEQILELAKTVKECGAGFLRGGAFKPRTSPYSFQGMKLEGLELLKLARRETGLPIVTEIMSADMIDRFVEDVDVIQVGARNMQNFELLKELGRTRKPILLKRGLSATIEELLMSAEYVMSEGNSNVILCERGIRTFETYTRNTLDISAVLAIKKLSHLPVIVDPSHAAGLWWMVEPLAKAAVAVGADGIMVEVHNDPVNAKCDGQQSIKPERFRALMEDINSMAGAIRRIV
ncbi:MAG TPA: 3-deoxy-7-phosphoheptulonate synthase [Clostridia bacterium]|nr:3-deoxy-7-phosphoheptulonate synthase [Clostridia bacterium]